MVRGREIEAETYQKLMEQARERRRRNEYRETYNEIHKAIENITRTANTQIVPLQLIKGVGAVIWFMIGAAKFFLLFSGRHT